MHSLNKIEQLLTQLIKIVLLSMMFFQNPVLMGMIQGIGPLDLLTKLRQTSSCEILKIQGFLKRCSWHSTAQTKINDSDHHCYPRTLNNVNINSKNGFIAIM